MNGRGTRPARSFVFATLCLGLLPWSGAAPAATPTDTEVNARAEKLLAQLTLDEKITLMAGGSAFGTAAIPRLGIPALRLSDGPNGVRSNDEAAATVFPTGSALAATWDPAAVRAVGAAIGREARALGVSVILGPNVNIQRLPIGGRDFEMYSEDPLLSGRMGAAFVEGLQGEGVGASVKHFVANEQELNRQTISSNLDERTLREIYLRPFELIVREAHPWTLMASYNRLNGIYMTENPLIRRVLEGEWGFEGLLMSDWGAVHAAAPAADAGTDLEMPGPPKLFGAPLRDAVRAGQVPQAVIDDAVRRVLRTIVRSGVLDGRARPDGELRSARNHEAALTAARGAVTLLKNDGGLLPLSAGSLRTLAVIGPNADVPLYQGGGSASVVPGVVSTPLQQLRALAPAVKITYARGVDNDEVPPPIDPRLLSPGTHRRLQGLSYRYYATADITGRPVKQGISAYFDATMIAGSLVQMSARLEGYLWPQQSGSYQFSLSQIGTGRLYIDGTEVVGPETGSALPAQIDFGSGMRLGRVQLESGRRYRLRVDYVSAPIAFHSLHIGMRTPLDGIEAAVAAARAADAAVVFVGSSRGTETEGRDRASLALSAGQDELVQAVLRANPRTVVVLQSGSPYALPWADHAPAIVQGWLNGEGGPQAVAEVLLGMVNPSGHLPVTFPKRLVDTPASLYYSSGPDADYGEGVFVGYRYYDAKDIEPAFPFGHGLSYTTFAYRNLVVPARVAQGVPVTVSVDVTNTGARAGAEVVQLYVGDQATRAVVRPQKELKAFRKVSLQPGQTTTVSFTLNPRDFEYYDVHAHRWAQTPGPHRIIVGASSRDIRASRDFELVAAQ
ncbi:MAG TPA: glycoside hydrolase family 3 C-terminal domain-containing protein [Steroidobacteraceae bacterium]|nr:glycoside hydrolase family 3 C-terminal domain-containing protein [Steroidobacteraceae bacterium]